MDCAVFHPSKSRGGSPLGLASTIGCSRSCVGRTGCSDGNNGGLKPGHLHLIANDEPIEPPFALLPVTLGILVLFGTFVTAAILLRRRAGYHRRLMALACLSIL